MLRTSTDSSFFITRGYHVSSESADTLHLIPNAPIRNYGPKPLTPASLVTRLHRPQNLRGAQSASEGEQNEQKAKTSRCNRESSNTRKRGPHHPHRIESGKQFKCASGL